jgi:nicotinamidase-related amidase
MHYNNIQAIQYDYRTVVLSDATASASEEVQRANLHDIAKGGGHVLTVGEWRPAP